MIRVMACVAALFGALVLSPARPVGAVTNYTGGGFDTCAAPSVSQMSAWLGSPYRSIGIYVGGVNRACATGNLSASWVSTVKAMGWNLVPLYVGFQAPCVTSVRAGHDRTRPSRPRGRAIRGGRGPPGRRPGAGGRHPHLLRHGGLR